MKQSVVILDSLMEFTVGAACGAGYAHTFGAPDLAFLSRLGYFFMESERRIHINPSALPYSFRLSHLVL